MVDRRAMFSRLWKRLFRIEEDDSDPNYTIGNAWRDHLAPVFRKHGFRGSGAHFHAVQNEFALAINLQRLRQGGAFTVNLGVHSIGAPDILGRPITTPHITELACLFRGRLMKSGDTNYRHRWWHYGRTAASRSAAAQKAAALFEIRGMEQFAEMIGFALSATLEDVAKSRADIGKALALTRENQGRIVEARAFAELARMKSENHEFFLKPIAHLLEGR